jgi:hypothetical protein
MLRNNEGKRDDDDVSLVGANIYWSGVEVQATLNAIMAHRILLEPSHQKGKP